MPSKIPSVGDHATDAEELRAPIARRIAVANGPGVRIRDFSSAPAAFGHRKRPLEGRLAALPLLTTAMPPAKVRAVTAEGALQPGAAVDPAANAHTAADAHAAAGAHAVADAHTHAIPHDQDAHDAGDGPLYCYRHPKSETYVRCGRCDQPICPKCAVQGPVGFRCRQCGLVKSATLSSFTPQQLLLGSGIALGGGGIVGYLGGSIGFYSIFIAFFAGAFIAEGFVRFVGLKRGPLPRLMLYGGLLAGFAVGALLQVSTFLGGLPAEAGMTLQLWLQTELPFIAIGAGATLAGAYSRVRWF
jgi:hypothetical protein